MELTFNESQEQPILRDRVGIRLSVEVILYIGLLTIALLLRVLDLEQAPLDDRQAHEALAALHRVEPNLSGEPVIAKNPLMTFFNQIVFFFANESNTSARLMTALAGVVLVFAPILLRSAIGKTTALAMTFFLAVSPVALASARTMGATTWTMMLVLIGLWVICRYLETGEKPYALAATMIGGAVLFLTEPTGIVTLIGLAVGLAVAMSLSEDERTLHRVLSGWPWAEGLMATLALVVVVGTGFFATPEGLTSVGNTIYDFLHGITEKSDNIPTAYALLIALRYDLGLIIFGLIGLYFAIAEGDFFSRFWAGWLMWSLVAGLLYAGATPDAGLWITIPATGLTATMVTRMLRGASYGFWAVPEWAIPIHAVLSAAMLVAIVLNTTAVARALQRESVPAYRQQITSPAASAQIGTFDEKAIENTFDLPLGGGGSIVVQVWRIDDSISPVMRIENEQGLILYGPFTYPDDSRGIVQQIEFFSAGNYFIKVAQDATKSYSRGQFVVLTHPPDAQTEGLLGGGFLEGYRLDIPVLWTFTRSISNQNVNINQPLFKIVVTFFLIMLLIIGFFLAGSIWGNRAAWRGLGFGFLLYFSIYGVGLGWQASTTFAEDPREFWQADPPSHRLNRLVQTLEQMSRFDNGERHQITVTVMGEDDGALAWALREFDHVEYVNRIGLEINSGAVLVPMDAAQVVLGADYVGQELNLGDEWSLSSLSWTDFIAWLTLRETRYLPTVEDHYRLWIRSDIYGVQEVPK